MFFHEVSKQYNAKFVLKADDDNWIRLDRMPYALEQWENNDVGRHIADSEVVTIRSLPCF